MKRTAIAFGSCVVGLTAALTLRHPMLASLAGAKMAYALPILIVAVAGVAISTAVVTYAFLDVTTWLQRFLTLAIAAGWLVATNGADPSGVTAFAAHVAVRSIQGGLIGLSIALFFARIAQHLMRRGRSIAKMQATLWCGLLLWALIVLLSFSWIAHSRDIWYWDNALWSDMTEQVTAVYERNGLASVLQGVSDSLPNEYNLVPVIPLALMQALLGHADRLLFIASIALFYTGPTVLAAAYLLYRATLRRLSGLAAIVIAVVSLALFPVIFYSPLLGLPDIGGLVVLVLIVSGMYEPESSSTKGRIARVMLIGIGVFCLCVFRRWYAFVAIPALVVSVGLELLANDVGLSKRDRMINLAYRLCVLGSVLLLCGIAFYWSRLIVMATTSYADAYKAYAQSYAVEYSLLLGNVGAVALTVSCIALVGLLCRTTTRATAITVGISLIFVIVAFMRVQGAAVQHYLLVLPALAFVVSLALGTLYVEYPRIGLAAIAVVALCAAASIAGVLLPTHSGYLRQHRLIPTRSMVPPTRGDYSELMRLSRDIGKYALAGSRFCATASGQVLNSSIMREAIRVSDPTNGDAIQTKLIELGDIDRRDGPAQGFLDCDAVVTTDPVNVHLALSEQQVVVYLNNAVIANRGIGQSFRPTGERYTLNRGVTAQIYRRVAPIRQADWLEYEQAVQQKTHGD